MSDDTPRQPSSVPLDHNRRQVEKLAASVTSPMEAALACAHLASSHRTMDDKLNPIVKKIVQEIEQLASMLSSESAQSEITPTTNKESIDYIPLCDAHACSWFTERNHLKGGMNSECVVCAHEAPTNAATQGHPDGEQSLRAEGRESISGNASSVVPAVAAPSAEIAYTGSGLAYLASDARSTVRYENVPDNAAPSAGTSMPRTFEYLLNAMEAAAQEQKPAEHEYGEKRRRVFQYVQYLFSNYQRRNDDATAASVLVRELERELAEAHAGRIQNSAALHDMTKRCEAAEKALRSATQPTAVIMACLVNVLWDVGFNSDDAEEVKSRLAAAIGRVDSRSHPE